MSLINDALKRAKQAHTENPTPTPDLPFRSAEPSPQRNSGLPLLPLAALIVALVLGGGFIIMALHKRDTTPKVVHAAQPEVTLSPDTAVPPATPTMTTATTVTQSTAPTTAATQPQTAVTDPTIGSPSDSTVDVPVTGTIPELPKPTLPKLQGIFYHPDRPSAVVSGKTVYVGSRAGEARDFLVLEISRQSVTVANGSQTNVLVMEE